jgi:hypothetical protein
LTELSERLIIEFEEHPIWKEVIALCSLRLGLVRNELEGFQMSDPPKTVDFLRGEAQSLRWMMEAPDHLKKSLGIITKEGEQDEMEDQSGA